MTLDLAAIWERRDKTTGGSWFYDSYSRIFSRLFENVTEANEHEAFADIASVPSIERGDEALDDQARHNAQFIAHAHDDIPTLIKEVERLQMFFRKMRLAISKDGSVMDILARVEKVLNETLEDAS